MVGSLKKFNLEYKDNVRALKKKVLGFEKSNSEYEDVNKELEKKVLYLT